MKRAVLACTKLTAPSKHFRFTTLQKYKYYCCIIRQKDLTASLYTTDSVAECHRYKLRDQREWLCISANNSLISMF